MNKKGQILAAAIKLFNTYGFDKTPTSLIAKEAGVATGTLFHYFSTKEELINHLYLKCKDNMMERAFKGVENEKSYRSKFRKTYDNMIRWGVEYKDDFLFFQQFSNSPSISESTKEEGRIRFEAIHQMILQGIEEEIFKEIDPEFLINLLFGLFSTNILYLVGNPEKLQDPDFFEVSFTVLWDAIKR